MKRSVRVKICGVTTPADAVLAAQLGADAVGLNFYARSPRCIDEATALAILRQLPPFLVTVGVFAQEVPENMVAVARRLRLLHALQSHGAMLLPSEVDPFHLIQAVAIKDTDCLKNMTVYLERCRSADRLPAAVLVDAHVPGLHGGTGTTAPWELLADFNPGVPLILAGGLTPDNVADAIRRVRPYAVDVASGVESAPGRKDPDLMRRFLDAVRTAT